MAPNLPRHHSLANPAGYAIAAKYQTSNDSLVPSIEEALQDRALLDQLCDRVYQLMIADLQQQQDRSRNYRGW